MKRLLILHAFYCCHTQDPVILRICLLVKNTPKQVCARNENRRLSECGVDKFLPRFIFIHYVFGYTGKGAFG